MTSQTRIIKGDWLDEQYLVRDLVPRNIRVQVVDGARGRLIDDEHPMRLWAERWSDGAEFITNGVWCFAPDAGELERCGITPAADDTSRAACGGQGLRLISRGIAPPNGGLADDLQHNL